MNENTRVVIHCYAGDFHQLNMGAYLHHECPVTVISPEDSKAIGDVPGVDYVHAGKRAYIGQDSLDRQFLHLKRLLEYPEEFFLCHDSDSVLLDAQIPDYLYAEPDLVWSNQVNDNIYEHQAHFPHGWPHVAFQPPYFLSRKTIAAMVAVQEKGHPFLVASPMMPFIDFYMVQLTMVAGLGWKRFHHCLSCPVCADPKKVAAGTVSERDQQTYEMGWRIAVDGVSKGANFVHSVKDPAAVDELLQMRRQFLGLGRAPQIFPAPRVGNGRPSTPGLKA